MKGPKVSFYSAAWDLEDRIKTAFSIECKALAHARTWGDEKVSELAIRMLNVEVLLCSNKKASLVWCDVSVYHSLYDGEFPVDSMWEKIKAEFLIEYAKIMERIESVAAK